MPTLAVAVAADAADAVYAVVVYFVYFVYYAANSYFDALDADYKWRISCVDYYCLN